MKEVLSIIRGEGIHSFHGDPTGCKTLEKPEGDHIVFGVSSLQIIKKVTGLLRGNVAPWLNALGLVGVRLNLQ